MAADLEIFDESGNATLTASTLFGRVLGSFNTGTANGSRYFPGLTTGNASPWYFALPTGAEFITSLPLFTVANDTISWTFQEIYQPNNVPATRYSCNVIVGTN